MKFTQGKAPTILYRDGARVWEFRGGRFETEDAGLIALLRERGAIEEGGERSVESGVGKPAEAAPPEPAKPRRKTAKAGDAKQLHYVPASPASPPSTIHTEEAP